MKSDTLFGDFMANLVWGLCGDSMESDTLFGDFMANLVWGLCGDSMESDRYSLRGFHGRISTEIVW